MPAVLGQVAVPQDLLGQVGQRVGAALPGVAAVEQPLAAGQRLQCGQDDLGLLGCEPEPPGQRPVLSPGRRQVPPGVCGAVVVVQGRFAVGGDQVRDVLPEAVRVPAGRHQHERVLRLPQLGGRDPPDQAGQHRGLLLGELAVQDRVHHERQVPQRRGDPQPRPGGAGGRSRRLGQPPDDRAAAAVVGRDLPAGHRGELPRRPRHHAVEAVARGGYAGQEGLQLGRAQLADRHRDQAVDRRLERRQQRGHARSLPATSDSSARRNLPVHRASGCVRR